MKPNVNVLREQLNFLALRGRRRKAHFLSSVVLGFSLLNVSPASACFQIPQQFVIPAEDLILGADAVYRAFAVGAELTPKATDDLNNQGDNGCDDKKVHKPKHCPGKTHKNNKAGICRFANISKNHTKNNIVENPFYRIENSIGRPAKSGRPRKLCGLTCNMYRRTISNAKRNFLASLFFRKKGTCRSKSRKRSDN